MANTLFDAVLETARLVGRVRYGLATSGSTSNFVDNNSTMRPEPDDYFNGGVAFIISNADSPGAAPEKEFGRVSDWAYSSGTLTIATNPAFTAAVGSGDRYGISSGRFSLDDIINAVNVSLSGMYVPAVNSTALDTADNQTEYSLPTGIGAHNLRQVHVQLLTSDTNDNQWQELRDWSVIQHASGTQDVLVLPQLSSGYDIRLDYVTNHTPIYSSTSSVHEYIHLDRVKYRAAEFLYADELGWDDNYKNAGNMANFYASKAQDAEVMHPIRLPELNGRVVTYGTRESNYTGEVGKVRL